MTFSFVFQASYKKQAKTVLFNREVLKHSLLMQKQLHNDLLHLGQNKVFGSRNRQLQQLINFQAVYILHIISYLMQSSSLSVRPVEANLIHQPEWTLRMNPLCRVFLGHQSQQTSEASSGGKTPKWGETLVFQNSGDLDLRVEVWDTDLSNNAMIVGSGSVNLTKIMNIGGGGAATWIDLGYKGRNAGRLCLAIQPGKGGQLQEGKGQHLGMEIQQGKMKQAKQGAGFGSGQGISSESKQGMYGVGQTSQGLSHAQGQQGMTFGQEKQGTTHVMGTQGTSRGFGQQDISEVHEKQSLGLQQGQQATSFGQEKQGTTHAMRQQGTSRGFGQKDISRPYEQGLNRPPQQMHGISHTYEQKGQQFLNRPEQQGFGQQGFSQQGLSQQQGLSKPGERMIHPLEKQSLGQQQTSLGYQKHQIGQGTSFGQEKQGFQQQGLTYPPEKQGLGQQGITLAQEKQGLYQQSQAQKQSLGQQGQGTYGTGGSSSTKH